MPANRSLSRIVLLLAVLVAAAVPSTAVAAEQGAPRRQGRAIDIGAVETQAHGNG
jgi:hypothetical protein